MLEQGATPFDIKEGFKKSPKARHTIAKYNKKGKIISPGGQWYLTVPFRIGVPGTLGQAGFSGEMPTEMFLHFFKSLSDAAMMNLYVEASGDNEHHKIEGVFKALARSLKMAIRRDIWHYELPSTKGVL